MALWDAIFAVHSINGAQYTPQYTPVINMTPERGSNLTIDLIYMLIKFAAQPFTSRQGS